MGKQAGRFYIDNNRPGEVQMSFRRGGKIQNFWFPIEMIDPASPNYDPSLSIAQRKNVKDLNQWIAKVQFSRIRLSINNWRNAIIQAEDPIFPYRWAMAQIYQDAILDGHIAACMDVCKRLTMQRQAAWFRKGEAIDTTPDNLDFIHSPWWGDLISYLLDARWHGYQLVALDNMVINKAGKRSFPNLHVVRRQNISPDRENVTPVIGMIEGIRFSDPEETAEALKASSENQKWALKTAKPISFTGDTKAANGERYSDWHIWVSTKNDYGSSKCGFGLLYKCIPYWLAIKNGMNDYTKFIELFGQPIRTVKTDKQGKERDNVERNLAMMGASNYMLLGKGDGDTFELHQAPAVGESFKAYENNIELNKKFITAIIFGHEDAMRSIPGRLGSQQGMEESPINKAKRETESEQTKWLNGIINGKVRDKLNNLGFGIPDDLEYGYLNDEELSEQKDTDNKHNSDFADVIQKLAAAGFKPKADFVAEYTGIPVEEVKEVLQQPNFSENLANKIKNIYAPHT